MVELKRVYRENKKIKKESKQRKWSEKIMS